MEEASKLPVTEFITLCQRAVDTIGCRRLLSKQDDGTWMRPECLESLAAVFRLAVGNDSSDQDVLASLSGLDKNHAQALLGVLRAREEEIRQALMHATNNKSRNTLQDFDWQLKLALSSDKISTLQTPLLNLCLDVREDGALRPITLEMSKEELGTLISSLEAANRVVLQLK